MSNSEVEVKPNGLASALPFVFASLVTAYPEESVRTQVLDLSGEPALELSPGLLEVIRSRMATVADAEDLASEYIDLFDRGKELNPLYETEYGKSRALAKGTELSDLAGFYRAFGLDPGAEGCFAEMLDHVSLELEFYGFLMMQQALLEAEQDQDGIEIVLDARKKFMNDHLGRFVSSIASRSGVQASEFYSKIYEWCSELVTKECALLGVNPLPAHWIPEERDQEKMACGGSVGCMK